VGPLRAESIEEGRKAGLEPSALQRLEAVLFLAREPLSARKLAQWARLADATEARTLVAQLNSTYDALGMAFRVYPVAGGFQFLSRPQFSAWIESLWGDPGPWRTALSLAVLETLCIVAFQQPVLRAEIEAIRGVRCGEVLRQLMEMDLVRITGRSNELGRPLLYGTTRRFLQVFGLRHLEDLSTVAKISAYRREKTTEESIQQVCKDQG